MENSLTQPEGVALSTVSRIICPSCGAQCIEREFNCWQCGSLLNPPAPSPESTDPQTTESEAEVPVPSPEKRSFWQRKKAAPPPRILTSDELIKFDGLTSADLPPQPEIEPEPAPEIKPLPETRTATTLTGEVVELPVERTAQAGNGSGTAAAIGSAQIAANPQKPLFIQSFCNNCGYQNEEDVRECAKCKSMLLVLEEPLADIEPLPRAWGFDVLGAAWIVLGIAAIFCGRFLLRANPEQHGASIADYFWTGVVACAPGMMIFIRHMFCKLMFWVMTLASIMVWAVIGTVWILGYLQVSDNAEVGLVWLAVLSSLSFISFVTVRLNDAFDYSFDFQAHQ